VVSVYWRWLLLVNLNAIMMMGSAAVWSVITIIHWPAPPPPAVRHLPLPSGARGGGGCCLLPSFLPLLPDFLLL